MVCSRCAIVRRESRVYGSDVARARAKQSAARLFFYATFSHVSELGASVGNKGQERGLTNSRIRPSWRQLATSSRGPAAIIFKNRTCIRTCYVEELLAPRRSPFPANSGPDRAARPRAARDGHADHRPPRAGLRQARQALPRRHQDHLQDHQSGDHLHRDRHRRVGGGAGQHAVARRPRADGGDRPVRHAVEEHGGEARPASRIHHDRLAHRRRSGGDRGPSAQGQEQGDQGGLRAAQRDLDRLPLADRGDPQGDRRRRPPGAASSSTPSPRSPRPTIATTNGASTSPSAARRRG